MIKFIRIKTDEYSHNDDQILKSRVVHMNKFIRLKTYENSHNDDQILKARVTHMIKFTRLKTSIVIMMTGFSKQEQVIWLKVKNQRIKS